MDNSYLSQVIIFLLCVPRPLCGVVNVMVQACGDCLETSQYMVYSNKLGSVVDLLVYQFKVSLHLFFWTRIFLRPLCLLLLSLSLIRESSWCSGDLGSNLRHKWDELLVDSIWLWWLFFEHSSLSPLHKIVFSFFCVNIRFVLISSINFCSFLSVFGFCL